MVALYLYALKSPVTREKYQKRLEKFFDFLELDSATAEKQEQKFYEKNRKNVRLEIKNIFLFSITY